MLIKITGDCRVSKHGQNEALELQEGLVYLVGDYLTESAATWVLDNGFGIEVKMLPEPEIKEEPVLIKPKKKRGE